MQSTIRIKLQFNLLIHSGVIVSDDRDIHRGRLIAPAQHDSPAICLWKGGHVVIWFGMAGRVWLGEIRYGGVWFGRLRSGTVWQVRLGLVR